MGRRRTTSQPCPDPRCPNLAPCPKHSRPANASWSKDRDMKAHWRLRTTVIKKRGAVCERCGWVALDGRGKGLAMHHIRPGDQEQNVILLCGRQGNNCHGAVDGNAR